MLVEIISINQVNFAYGRGHHPCYINYMKIEVVKNVVIVVLLMVVLGEFYVMFQYKTFGGPKVALAINTNFNYLEDLFQRDQEETPSPNIVDVLPVKIPIIIYHSVRPYIPDESILQDRFDLTPELLEQQLAYLQDHGYTTISLDDLERDIKRGTTTPVLRPVVLTFDDGWRNQYRYAFPLLKKYHMQATFYVYTNPVDNEAEHFLTWEQIKEMAAAGMTIGSHTLSHPYFGNSSSAEMRKEIFESKRVLERNLGKTVLHFAQPFGYTSPGIEALIKEAGYETSRGTHRGVYHSQGDIFHLQGYFVSDSFDDFVQILNR